MFNPAEHLIEKVLNWKLKAIVKLSNKQKNRQKRHGPAKPVLLSGLGDLERISLAGSPMNLVRTRVPPGFFYDLYPTDGLKRKAEELGLGYGLIPTRMVRVHSTIQLHDHQYVLVEGEWNNEFLFMARKDEDYTLLKMPYVLRVQKAHSLGDGVNEIQSLAYLSASWVPWSRPLRY